ncbi:MAG TPA: NAD(P)/FAD-dependent oxidoreductase [Solirubrobacterales bacterium]|jgi:2-polyprenyl-6-methoxyphenol hydroxylase-like FAD-dependent oxidoreductase
MADMERANIIADGEDYDAVIVGASLAGCATAIDLGRAGLRVALVEQRPDRAAFKRACSHYIQASAVPTLERLELLEPIMAAGALRTRARAWTPGGWIVAPPERAGQAVNLRRQLLDPLVREVAAATEGVELLLGQTAKRLVREDGVWRGVVVRDCEGDERELRGRLVVGADGRDSSVAELAGLHGKTLPHGRFAYGAYFEGPLPEHHPDSSLWFLDPDVAAAFPTDSGLVFYVAMPTKDRLAEFKRDPATSLVEHIASVPGAPPIREARRVGPVIGKIEMPSRVRGPIAPGLALIGDAALAADPLFGVGCGWAFQSAEWLTEAVSPALQGSESLPHGLRRYRRMHRRKLRLHAMQIQDYANGRRLTRPERMMMGAAAHDPVLAARFDAFATRRVGVARTLATTVPRALAVNARQALSRRGARADREPRTDTVGE